MNKGKKIIVLMLVALLSLGKDVASRTFAIKGTELHKMWLSPVYYNSDTYIKVPVTGSVSSGTPHSNTNMGILNTALKTVGDPVTIAGSFSVRNNNSYTIAAFQKNKLLFVQHGTYDASKITEYDPLRKIDVTCSTDNVAKFDPQPIGLYGVTITNTGEEFHFESLDNQVSFLGGSVVMAEASNLSTLGAYITFEDVPPIQYPVPSELHPVLNIGLNEYGSLICSYVITTDADNGYWLTLDVQGNGVSLTGFPIKNKIKHAGKQLSSTDHHFPNYYLLYQTDVMNGSKFINMDQVSFVRSPLIAKGTGGASPSPAPRPSPVPAPSGRTSHTANRF